MQGLRLRNAALKALRSSITRIPATARQWNSFNVAKPTFQKSSSQFTVPSSQFRTYSQQPPPRKIYTFQDVQAHLKSPSANRILIDTREPHELQTTGTIPGSINIPISSKPDSFHISEEEFEDRFGFERPSKETEIVVYCKAGVRSRAAAELARQQGWTSVMEYEGSWLDWEKNGGETEGVR